MCGIRLYFRYARVWLKGEAQYSGWPIKLFTAFIGMAADPTDALVMLDRFGGIGEFSASRLLLMYGMALLCYGLAECFARGFDVFPGRIRSGEFDTLLLRPRTLFLQSLTLRFNLSRLARAVGGAILVVWSVRAQGLPFAPGKALILPLAVIGGTLTYAGVFMLSAAVTFYTVQPVDWVNIFTNGSYQAAKAPPDCLPRWMRDMFTYVMPMMFFTYFPASALCGWGEALWKGYLALPVGAAFCALGALVFGRGARRYRSTGS